MSHSILRVVSVISDLAIFNAMVMHMLYLP